MASAHHHPYLYDEQAAFAALEAVVWPNGRPPACPHCGETERLNRLAVQMTKRSKRNPEGKPVYGLWKCYACRRQFTVRKGTLFQDSRLELHLWFRAAYLISGKGPSTANDLHRILGVTRKTALHLSRRLRQAMQEGHLPLPFVAVGGAGQASAD